MTRLVPVLGPDGGMVPLGSILRNKLGPNGATILVGRNVFFVVLYPVDGVGTGEVVKGLAEQAPDMMTRRENVITITHRISLFFTIAVLLLDRNRSNG